MQTRASKRKNETHAKAETRRSERIISKSRISIKNSINEGIDSNLCDETTDKTSLKKSKLVVSISCLGYLVSD